MLLNLLLILLIKFVNYTKIIRYDIFNNPSDKIIFDAITFDCNFLKNINNIHFKKNVF